MVEHHVRDVGVASSNLVTSTKRKQDILKNVLLPFFVYLQDLNLRHEAPNAQHLAETVRGTVSQRVPYISVLDYSFLPVEQPECPASFFVYLQDLNLRHEAPNAKHLAETVRGTVSQRVPYISVIDYSFLPVEQPECPASFFCLFARFELATRGSKCAAFGRNSPGDCFAASALYLCARLRISAGGAARFLRRCSTYCSTW